ncbi:hypothetical protein MMC07_000490 [Pseudocyphellaria aurata]|nr:hypothetical protein [Pseudocyphellaria aurata]
MPFFRVLVAGLPADCQDRVTGTKQSNRTDGSYATGVQVPAKKLTSETILYISEVSEFPRPTQKVIPMLLKMAEKLHGLSLVLATAGAYLDQVSTSFEEYLNFYRTS